MKAVRALFAEFRSGKGLKGQLLRGGVGSVAVKIGSTLLSIALAVVLARALGAEGFGVYSFVFALITILAIPAQMGLPNLVVRETAKAHAVNDWPLINGLWRWATLMALMMSAALIVVGALAAWFFAARLPEGGLTVFYWGLVLVPLIALGNLRGAALRGLRHVVKGQLPEFILRPAFLVVLVLGAHFGLSAHALTASDAMMLHALASLVAFMIGAFLLLRARPAEMRAETRTKTHPRAWLAAALPLALADNLYMINQNVGMVILGMFRDAEEVGLFRIAMQGSLLVAFGLTAANVAVAPYIARLYHKGELAALQRLMTQMARIVLLIALPIAIVFFVYGQEIITVMFGPDFEDAYPALVILIGGQVVNSFVAGSTTLLNMTGNERKFMTSMAVSAALNVLLVTVLVPFVGLLGAAIAASASRIIWHLQLFLYCHHLLRINCSAFGGSPKSSSALG